MMLIFYYCIMGVPGKHKIIIGWILSGFIHMNDGNMSLWCQKSNLRRKFFCHILNSFRTDSKIMQKRITLCRSTVASEPLTLTLKLIESSYYATLEIVYSPN